MLQSLHLSIKFLFLGSDYSLVQPVELVLSGGVTRTCADIVAIGDEVYEDNESFFAVLSSPNDDVIITTSSASILIIDNDGKWLA